MSNVQKPFESTLVKGLIYHAGLIVWVLSLHMFASAINVPS